MLSVVINTNTLHNPLVDAWVDSFENAGIRVAILADVPESEIQLLPKRFLGKTVLFEENNDWKQQIEFILGGFPTAIFYWWGLASLKRKHAEMVWASSRIILCIDTFPNASWLLSEIKESFDALLRLRKVDAFIVPSHQMEEMMKSRFGKTIENASFHKIDTPFSAKSHSSQRRQITQTNPKFIFTGRSDFLYSEERNMAKDNLAPILESFLSEGVEIFVNRPQNDQLAYDLDLKGYKFYPNISREGILDGSFTNMIVDYSAHIVAYSIPNQTIRRRIQNGLSTRFALAICSETPIIAQPESIFAIDFLDKFQIGISMKNSARETIDELVIREQQLRINWNNEHQKWAGDAISNPLRLAVMGI